MARLSDMDRRDSEHVLRTEIALILGRYARRMLDKGKALITEEMAQIAKSGGDVDGTAVGRAVAERVKAEYFIAKPQPAIEVSPTNQLTAGAQGASTAGTSAPSRANRKR